MVVDTAHNKEGLTIVLKQLSNETFNSLHIVLGMVSDKNLARIVPLFPKAAQYYFCAPQISRALPVKKLMETAHEFELEGNSYKSVKEAYRVALTSAEKNDLIFVGGSTFVVAEVL